MPATAPDSLVATTLAGVSGLGVSWAVDTNIFVGLELPVSVAGGVPHQAVFVAEYSGPAPVPYLGTGDSYWRKNVQVMVRSNPGEQKEGLVIARAVLALLHAATMSGYVQCLAQQSTPTPLGRDATNHYRWSVNVQLQLAA